MSVKAAYHRALARLRPDQLGKLDAVEWLISSSDGDRQSGRTHLMCLAHLRDALANPGRKVQVQDHFRSDVPGSSSNMAFLALRSIIGPGVTLQQVELSPNWVRVNEGHRPFPRSRIRAAFQAVSDERLAEAVDEVKFAVRAALRLGIRADDVLKAAREALVESVMEE